MITETRSMMVRAVHSRAQKRAWHSDQPGKFMSRFEDTLERLKNGGEGNVLDRAPMWTDPTSLAAEVEALSAYRAMAHWGTHYGICHRRGSGPRYCDKVA